MTEELKAQEEGRSIGQQLAIAALCLSVLAIAVGFGILAWTSDEAVGMKVVVTGFIIGITAGLGGILDNEIRGTVYDR